MVSALWWARRSVLVCLIAIVPAVVTPGVDAGLADAAPSAGTATAPTDPVALLELEKRAELVEKNGNRRAEIGEPVRYTFIVHNPGESQVTELRIADAMLERAGVRISCSAWELASGESTTCSATYVVAAADIGRDLVNVATAHGSAIDGPVVSAAADAAVPTAGVLAE